MAPAICLLLRWEWCIRNVSCDLPVPSGLLLASGAALLEIKECPAPAISLRMRDGGAGTVSILMKAALYVIRQLSPCIRPGMVKCREKGVWGTEGAEI
jgi:hypothetical protein